MEFSSFLHDPLNVGNLISDSSAFSKPNLSIWKFSVHVLLKPSLKDFEHNLASKWNEHSYMTVWTVFCIALLWGWNENQPFRSYLQYEKSWIGAVAQSWLTLCDPMDCSLPGSSVHGISQARILEWVAFSYSRGSSWPWDQTHISCIAGEFFTNSATWEVPRRGLLSSKRNELFIFTEWMILKMIMLYERKQTKNRV